MRQVSLHLVPAKTNSCKEPYTVHCFPEQRGDASEDLIGLQVKQAYQKRSAEPNLSVERLDRAQSEGTFALPWAYQGVQRLESLVRGRTLMR